MISTTIHSLPSRANLSGFLVKSSWKQLGFVGLVGSLPDEDELLLGTVWGAGC